MAFHIVCVCVWNILMRVGKNRKNKYPLKVRFVL